MGGISYHRMNQPWKCPSYLVSYTFLLLWDRLLEITSQEEIWERNQKLRNPGGDGFFVVVFFQNLLILCVLLIPVYSSTCPTPCFKYCTCQNYSCPVFSHHVTNMGKGRGKWLYGVIWSLYLNQSSYQLCCPPVCEMICYWWTPASRRW